MIMKNKVTAMKLNFKIDKEDNQKIYLQLFYSLKKLIEDNELKANDKIPSIRQISMKYKLNNLTVLKAYDLLEQENLIYKIPGKGCFVKEDDSSDSIGQKHVIDNFATSSKSINFASCSLAKSLYPISEFKDIFQKVFEVKDKELFNYGDTQGFLKLRREIVRYLKRNSIKTDEECVQIISGAQQGLEIIKKIMLKNKKNSIVLGEPTYYGAINTFHSDFKVHTIPFKEDGLDLEKLEKLLQTTKIDYLYAMFNFECPTGITWSIENMQKLLDLANTYDFNIIEDDCMSEFYYYNNKTVILKSLDVNDRVIYIKSFSKLIMPSLRIGYMVVPKSLISDTISVKFAFDISSSTIIQKALYLFLKESKLTEQIVKVRASFKKKYELAIKLLKKNKNIKLLYEPKGGVYLLLGLPSSINSEELAATLKDKNISVLPDTVFYPEKREKPNYIRISFASATLQEIRLGIDIINTTIDEMNQAL